MISHGKNLKIFTANANPELARGIANLVGVPLGESHTGTFSDGEISVNIYETVRGSDVFLVQSICNPVNDNLMELLIMLDAFKRASAGRVTAVIPYYGYARQDRKAKARDPISAKLLADLIATAGADRVLTMDLHAPQIQGFFNVPVDHLLGYPILAPYYEQKFKHCKDELVVVAPDLGSVSRSRHFCNRLEVPLAIIDKRRPKANVSEIMNIIGDVKDKRVILVDDLIDTAGTVCNAAKALAERGAKEVHACCTHPVLSGPAIERIQESPIVEMVVLDTIPLPEEKKIDKIKILSVAPVFAEAIERIYDDLSVSTMFV
jgi:ribose-phosphate pyrophosphokinase